MNVSGTKRGNERYSRGMSEPEVELMGIFRKLRVSWGGARCGHWVRDAVRVALDFGARDWRPLKLH